MAETRVRRKTALAAAILGVAGLAAGAALAQARPGEAYGKWWTVCDNGAACTVYGAGGGDGVGVVLVIQRGPEPQAPVRVVLLTDPPQRPAGGGQWRIQVGGQTVAAPRARQSGDVMRADLAGPDAASLVQRLLRADSVQIQGAGANAALSAAGAAAALRRMDQQQGRDGGATALASRGAKPLGAVPRPPELPIVRAAVLPAQTNLPSDPPLSGRAQKRCWATRHAKALPGEVQVYRLADDALLWLAPCGARDKALVLISNAKGGKARPAFGKRDSDPINASFDAATATLTTYRSDRNLADCGAATDYVWTGDGFEKVRERAMDECVGLPRDLWQDSFRAAVRRTS